MVKRLLVVILTVSVLFFSLNIFIGDESVYYIINVSTVFSAFLLLFIKKEEYPFAVKIATLTFISSISLAILYHVLSKFEVIEYLESIDNIKRLIRQTGGWGIVVFFFITLLQVTILPIPAAITIVVGSIVFNPLTSFLVSSIATLLGSIICFFTGRFFGKKLIKWLFDEEKAKKYSKILAKKGKVPFIIMMLLPFFPDDLICVTAGLSDMSFSFFSVSVAITRSVYILLVSYLGDGELIPFSGWGIPVWIGIFLITTTIGYLINKKINEKKKL